MFQSLTNYLLGSVSNQPDQQGATAEAVENSSIRLTAVEHDDDWVLVDKDKESDCDSDVCSVHSLDIEELDDRVSLAAPQVLTRSSSTASLQFVSNMEESWFITPPPCFTSAGPIHMETSPLENLLIEHPSMSVYQHPYRHRQVAFSTVTVRSASPSENGDADDDDVDVVEAVVLVRRTPRCNRLEVFQQQEAQKVRSRQAQKVQLNKACQSLKRSWLDKSNKAREANSRNRRQRRKERSQGATRSHANNNRKC